MITEFGYSQYLTEILARMLNQEENQRPKIQELIRRTKSLKDRSLLGGRNTLLNSQMMLKEENKLKESQQVSNPPFTRLNARRASSPVSLKGQIFTKAPQLENRGQQQFQQQQYIEQQKLAKFKVQNAPQYDQLAPPEGNRGHSMGLYYNKETHPTEGGRLSSRRVSYSGEEASNLDNLVPKQIGGTTTSTNNSSKGGGGIQTRRNVTPNRQGMSGFPGGLNSPNFKGVQQTYQSYNPISHQQQQQQQQYQQQQLYQQQHPQYSHQSNYSSGYKPNY